MTAEEFVYCITVQKTGSSQKTNTQTNIKTLSTIGVAPFPLRIFPHQSCSLQFLILTAFGAQAVSHCTTAATHCLLLSHRFQLPDPQCDGIVIQIGDTNGLSSQKSLTTEKAVSSYWSLSLRLMSHPVVYFHLRWCVRNTALRASFSRPLPLEWSKNSPRPMNFFSALQKAKVTRPQERRLLCLLAGHKQILIYG